MKLLLSVFSSALLLLFSNEEQCENEVLLTDFSIDDCIAKNTENTTYYYSIDEKTCIPGCTEYDYDGYYRRNCPCVPGYVCEKRCSGSNEAAQYKCEVDTECKKFLRSRCLPQCISNDNTCMSYYANTSDFSYSKSSAWFKPDCQNDGFWKSKQCKGGVNGKCICFDKFGTRLFGDTFYSKSKDMTCACSRRKAELMADGRSFVAFHCNDLGNFEKLQCDSGVCWCAEEKTGEPTSIIVPEKAMFKLPCYDVTTVGSQYLRQCDSAKYAMTQIERTLKNHGVTFINLGVRLCDGDGAFGLYNISDGIAYCTSRDGKHIGGYQSDSSTNLQNMTCRCARDYYKYHHTLTCESNGNYRAYQSVIQDETDYIYCVDSDGFQKSPLSTELPDCTKYI
ncbi:uncharacterized protein LOC130447368 isoform X1 [Diorhabda sublineata]|uniref:uncharacterized protein LOC130447368 isoform X1 n=1 Tax=Diorhabda sublineata TaxID=1163346 RepID=UPI0024E11221|nr:uncharacterized protein LOC130447368 isoform X1 [Diorhabda sublineata]